MSPTFIKEVDYVCENPSIHIEIKYISSIGGASVCFFINRKEAFSLTYRLMLPKDKDEYSEFLKNICDSLFKNLQIDEFTSFLSDDDCLKGEYIYKSLKVVRSKSGTIVWSRS